MYKTLGCENLELWSDDYNKIMGKYECGSESKTEVQIHEMRLQTGQKGSLYKYVGCQANH